jgi:2-desacetyl-2-hydroxyethyl bacteriochlorophyllide A dehydrogenase
MVIRQANVVELEEYDTPAPGADELLIATRSSLISPGTERAFFLGMPNAKLVSPIVPGYSAVGDVLQVGEDVGGWQVGERVAVGGSHASHLVAKADVCVRLPDGLPEEAATFFNMAAIAMQGVRKARIELGEPAIVIGAGIVGLLAMQLARLNGALPVIIVDRDEGRLKLAADVGADAGVRADADTLATVSRLCDGDGAPVVIEATGNPAAILSAFQMAARWGRVVLLGSTRGVTEEVNFYRDVHVKGLTVIGAHNSLRPLKESSPGRWTAYDDQSLALRLIAHERLTVQPLITHRFPAREAVQAYELLKSPELTALGIILDWCDV